MMSEGRWIEVTGGATGAIPPEAIVKIERVD